MPHVLDGVPGQPDVDVFQVELGECQARLGAYQVGAHLVQILAGKLMLGAMEAAGRRGLPLGRATVAILVAYQVAAMCEVRHVGVSVSASTLGEDQAQPTVPG